MLELRDLSRRYGDTVALDGLSLTVPAGEVVGFVGPNGAGKTTAMRIAMGVLEPESGEVLWDGRPVGREQQRTFGYMPEERGLAVASGVVEEKSSRVVEVLLAAITPRALLAGKVIGIGLLGLFQLFVTGVVGLAVAGATGALELDGPTIAALGVTLVWFLFGYAVWACLYAVSGVVVSRQEDLQASSTPLTMVLVMSYLVALPVLDDPSSTFAKVASLVPLSSPIVMPARVVLGEASAVEIVASLALLAATAAALIPLGARIYERAILRMGRPLKLGEALRAARRA